ncbi:hypothetical protein [Streptomyces sp. NPDC055607]
MTKMNEFSEITDLELLPAETDEGQLQYCTKTCGSTCNTTCSLTGH